MTNVVTIGGLMNFDDAFGKLGLNVGPRTGVNKRVQDDEEWYIIRRFLKSVLRTQIFALPLNVRKQCPPAPDFVLEHGQAVALVEITDAASEADQRDMTRSESSEDATLLGEHGGRFSDGIVGDSVERVWASDVLRAIRRKRYKSIFIGIDPDRHLVVHPNFPALSAVCEQEAVGILRDFIVRHAENLCRIANGCKIHVLGGEQIYFDVLENMRLIGRMD